MRNQQPRILAYIVKTIVTATLRTTRITSIVRPKRVGPGVLRGLVSTLVVATLLCATASPGQADPPADGTGGTPYPNTDLILTSYQRLNPEDFFIPGNYGVFFLSPTGLNCGIWIKGSFGCSGPIPGAPPGVDHIGWFNGEPRVHYDWTAAIQFPSVRAIRTLPPRSYLNWNETRCVTTAESNTYCVRGKSRFLITSTATWLNG